MYLHKTYTMNININLSGYKNDFKIELHTLDISL